MHVQYKSMQDLNYVFSTIVSEIRMNKTETGQNEEFLNTLREEYSKRIDEVDAFYKRATNMAVEVNTELLYGCLDTIQHYLDLQQKYSSQFPWLYSSDLITKVIRQNTVAWISAIQNIDTLCIDTMKNMKSNLKTLNKNTVQVIQNTQKIAETCKSFQTNAGESIPVIQKYPRPSLQKESSPT